MNFRARVRPDLPALPCLPLGYTRAASGSRGTQLSEGFALGWEYLTPRPVPERPQSCQNGLCFQPKSTTNIHTSALETSRAAPRLA